MVKFHFVTFIWLFVLLETEGSDTRIVGGSPALPRVAPYHASLQNLQGTHVCGGAIITNRAILSAAHCFVGALPEYIVVVVGTNNLMLDGQRYNVSKIVIHEGYNTTSKENDLAILITDTFIHFNNDIKPISLVRTFINNGETLTFTGFGAVSDSGETTPYMQIINLTVLDISICNHAYRNVRPLFSSQLCTFTTVGEGSCHGDSGAPLVMDTALVGIASFGIPCAKGYPDVFTRTSTFTDWIKYHAPGSL